jgi:predicted Zn-dependent peptidase
MIAFNRFKLENGLTVLHHFDPATPMAVVNTLYDVGARDESEDRTGFAHLFEHLMFGGSVNIPDFDAPLQLAGGESNAFTSNDITNYYNTLPVRNIETALWLESDRMLSLAFTSKSLEVQRNVVIEEFKQRYLNQPYGDVWLELRPLAYSTHPYKWATIGKEIRHIEEAVMDDVKAFFKAHYHPGNAILCIAGNISAERTEELVRKWYGDIPASVKQERVLPKEPEQQEYREKTIERLVPNNAFYYAFKMPARTSFEYYVTDIISDALGREKSSRLYGKLKKDLKLVTVINAYITGSFDEGLLVIDGRLSDGASFETLDKALWETLEEVRATPFSAAETSKLLNKIRTIKEFQEQGLLNRAMHLCTYELLGDANGVNEENRIYQSITAEHIQKQAQAMLRKENCSVLRVKAIQP